MSRESMDALKASLLNDPEVQMMIRMRAYEIYQIRGDQWGGPVEDWFRAESEVLAFLIDEENRRAAEEAPGRSLDTVAGVELVAVVAELGDPETSGGEAASEAPRKRARSATKATAAKKAGDGPAKKTTRRAAAPKAADSAEKPKRPRKKAEAPITQTNEQ